MTIVKVVFKKKFCTLCAWFDLNKQTLTREACYRQLTEPVHSERCVLYSIQSLLFFWYLISTCCSNIDSWHLEPELSVFSGSLLWCRMPASCTWRSTSRSTLSGPFASTAISEWRRALCNCQLTMWYLGLTLSNSSLLHLPLLCRM